MSYKIVRCVMDLPSLLVTVRNRRRVTRICYNSTIVACPETPSVFLHFMFVSWHMNPWTVRVLLVADCSLYTHLYLICDRPFTVAGAYYVTFSYRYYENVHTYRNVLEKRTKWITESLRCQV